MFELHIHSDNELYSAINILETDEKVEVFKLLGDTFSFDNVLDDWPRLSGKTFYENPDDATGTDTLAWQYDTTANTFYQSRNTSTNEMLLSPYFVEDDYEFTVELTSTSADDDGIGQVIGFQNTPTGVRFLVAWFHTGGWGGPPEVSIRYGDASSPNTGEVITTQNILETRKNADGGAGWGGNSGDPRQFEIKVKTVVRGDTISIMYSDWDNGDYLPNSEITLSFSNLPRDGYLLRESKRIGFGVISQANSYFNNYNLKSINMADSSLLYSAENKKRWDYNDTNTTWEDNGVTLYDDVKSPHIVNNPKTKETYILQGTTLTMVKDDGIKGSVPDLSMTPNNLITYDRYFLGDMYTYDTPIRIKKGFSYDNFDLIENIDSIIIETYRDSGTLYGYLEADDGTIAIEKYNITVEQINASALIFRNDYEAMFFQMVHTPTDPNVILDNWPRAQNTTYFPDPSLVNVSPADLWYVDTVENSIVMPENTQNYQHIVSPEKYDNFTFESTLTADTSDGDSIGLVVAADYIDGEFLSVVALLHTGGQKHLQTLTLGFFDSSIVGGSHKLSPIVLAGNDFLPQDPISTTVGNTNPDYGWWNRTVRVRVRRNNNMIYVAVSNWNESTVDSSSEISYDMNSLPNNGTKLLGKARYGFFSNSTANSYYLDYSIRDENIPDMNNIYSIESDTHWKYDAVADTWNVEGEVFDDFRGISDVENTLTKEQYIVDNRSLTFSVNNGISDGNAVLSLSPSSTTNVLNSNILSQFTYTEPMIISRVFAESNISVTLSGSSMDITTNATGGTFFVLITTASNVNAIRQVGVSV